MKKRFLTFILTIATMLMCIFGFSACGGNVEFKINFVVENEVYATVSTSGNEVISMPENPTKDDYTFDGWYWDENTWEKPFTANSLLDAPLSSDMKVYAKFNKNHTHEYTPTTTEPTCTEKGIITYTCTCGDSYTEDILATGEHTWDDGKVTTEPTCTEKGVKTFTCTVCKTATYTEDVKALTHDEKTHQAKAPTCTEIGWNEYVTCEREGCEYSTYKEIPATGVHTWDKGEETKAPTCTKEGEMTYTCMVCKTTTKTEPIDKLPHEHNTEKWTSNETHHWHECVCGDKKDEEKHTAGAPATATTPQTCTVCGYVLQVETGILFNTLTVNGTNVYGKVSNDTEIFSFINEITVKGDATYVVDVNMSCKDPIESKTVELSVGDNKFYVLEKIGNNVKLFTVTIRRRPMYDVTFNANGGTAVDKQVIEEDDLATEPETTRTGYTFTGWDYDFTQAITENTKITASWSANKDTKYTVNYYLQNLDDSNYTLHESVELTGETDTTATADVKDYEHFTFNQGYYYNKLSGNITPNGSQVLSIYYTRDTYSIVANNNNAKAGTSTQVNGEYKYDKQFMLTATTNAGYTWLGWYEGETLVCETEEFTFKTEKNVTYTATWSANTDTKYTVNYYLQNLNDSNYTLHEMVELTGTTDTPTAEVEIREYTHFTYNANKSVISGNINGDGGQVLSVYYTRDKYVISTARNNTKAGMVTAGGTYKFDKQITLTATTDAGYTWLGWYDGETLACATEEFTFKAEKDVTYTATWSANTDTKYTVNYYLQNLADDGYALHETVELTGETDTPTAEVDIKEYTHFTYNANKSVISGNIDGDGGQVLSVYYTRNTYTLSINNSDAGTITNSGTYKYGNMEMVSEVTTHIGYEFVGWYCGEELLSTDATYTFTVDKTVTAKFAVKEEMSNFNFTSTATACSITGLKDKTITEIVVPDYVTSISQGAFKGCSSLKSITIPFVGGSRKTATDTYQYPFGYIFGTSNYTGGTATRQYYYGSSTSSTTSTTYYIPTSLKAVTVTGVNILYGAFYYCNSLTSVVIGDSVTSIGDDAFRYCDSLTSIYITDLTAWCKISFGSYYANPLSYVGNLYLNNELVTELVIPDSVTSIGDYAFYNCSSLTSVEIGDSVTSIGNSAFYSCDGLTSVVIPESVTTIGDYAFYNCSRLTSITIGDSVTSIGSYAFYNCDSLTSVEIGDSVTSIGNYAFAYCDNFTSITIPDSVTSIGSYAFADCDSLTSITIGDSVTSIGGGAFENCSSLTSVYITDLTAWCYISFGTYNANPLHYAGNLYLNNELVTELEIGDSVTSIGGGAFYNCSSLTSVEIGDSVTSIGNSAFSGCSSLTGVEIGDSVTSIGGGAFYNCSSLTSVEIGDSVTSIGSYAFENCSSLTSVVIGDSVTSIGDEAFWRCCKLVEVVNKSTHITVTKGYSLNGYVGYYALAVYNSGDTFETKLSNDNGYIIYTDGNEKILVGYNGTETDLVLSSYITKINRYAFYYCDSLTSVVIGDSVTSIGGGAFYNCSSLTSVVIGDSVTTIAPSAFENCDSLTSIEIPDSVTSIGNYAFENCDSLTSVEIGNSVTSIGSYAFLYCSSLTSVIIPDSVTSIGDGAFRYCDSLTSVVIGDSVTSIGYEAFAYCDSLTSVVIGDSVTSIGSYAFRYCGSLTNITFKDTSTWYRTTSGTGWYNETGGTSTSVTDPSTNATYFNSTYYNYYWYKK